MSNESDPQRDDNSIQPIISSLSQAKSLEESKASVAAASKEDSSALPDMPPEVRRGFRSIMSTFQAESRSGISVLFEKFNDKHIDKYLDYIQRDYDHDFELAKTNQRYYLVYFIIAMVALGAAVVYLLPRDKAFLESIINILVILGGGIGAGYGLKSRSGR